MNVQNTLSNGKYDRASIFMGAARAGNLPIVKFYVAGDGLELVDIAGRTALMYAVQGTSTAVINYLLYFQRDLRDRDYLGCTVLMYAAQSGNLYAVDLLIRQGAEVNARDNDGETALMLAAGAGHEQIVRLLVKNGAVINVRSQFDGSTALMAAAAGGHKKIIRYLRNRRAFVAARDLFGHTALDRFRQRLGISENPALIACPA